MAVCAGVCPAGESCAVCLDGKTCENVEICAGSFCIANDTWTKATCRPLECAFSPVVPPLCGTPDALCGEECCQPDCAGRECGDDPRCGLSCGTCGPETFCDFEAGKCQLVAGVSACAGDLRATPPEIAVERGENPKPEASGGKIADGIYDLVATREYVTDAFSTVYERAALRFFDGATQAEQIYDPNRDYFLGDTDTPHRLLTVAAEGSVLHFTVSCPDSVISIYRAYDRGFTVQGSELWLFQPKLIEVYRARP